MGRMIYKYVFILDKLAEIGVTAYTGNAPTTAVYPFAVINYNTSNELNEMADGLFLDIDVWDINKKNYDAFLGIEALTDKIEQHFKYMRCSDDEHTYFINQVNRLIVPDSEQALQRRKLKFYVKAYKKYE